MPNAGHGEALDGQVAHERGITFACEVSSAFFPDNVLKRNTSLTVHIRWMSSAGLPVVIVTVAVIVVILSVIFFGCIWEAARIDNRHDRLWYHDGLTCSVWIASSVSHTYISGTITSFTHQPKFHTHRIRSIR